MISTLPFSYLPENGSTKWKFIRGQLLPFKMTAKQYAADVILLGATSIVVLHLQNQDESFVEI